MMSQLPCLHQQLSPQLQPSLLPVLVNAPHLPSSRPHRSKQTPSQPAQPTPLVLKSGVLSLAGICHFHTLNGALASLTCTNPLPRHTYGEFGTVYLLDMGSAICLLPAHPCYFHAAYAAVHTAMTALGTYLPLLGSLMRTIELMDPYMTRSSSQLSSPFFGSNFF